MIFIANFILIVLYGAVYNEAKNKYGKCKILLFILLSVTALQMVFLIGFRTVEVGIDTRSYLIIYNKYKSMTFDRIFKDTSQEHGYSLLIKISSMIYDNFDFFKTIAAIISIVPIVVMAGKYSKKPFLSILIFIAFGYYAFMFSGMRQGIAYSVCVLSYASIRNKKPVAFVFLILLAAQFHKSAYMFLPAYLFANIRLNKYTIIGLIMAYLLVIVFKDPLYNFIEGGLYTTPVHSYAAKETGALIILVRQIVIAAALVFLAPKDTRDTDYGRYTMLVSVGAILTIFATIGGNAQRAANYYCMFLILGIPELLWHLESVFLKRTVSVCVVVGVLAMFIYGVITDGYNIMTYGCTLFGQ